MTKLVEKDATHIVEEDKLPRRRCIRTAKPQVITADTARQGPARKRRCCGFSSSPSSRVWVGMVGARTMLARQPRINATACAQLAPAAFRKEAPFVDATSRSRCLRDNAILRSRPQLALMQFIGNAACSKRSLARNILARLRFATRVRMKGAQAFCDATGPNLLFRDFQTFEHVADLLVERLVAFRRRPIGEYDVGV